MKLAMAVLTVGFLLGGVTANAQTVTAPKDAHPVRTIDFGGTDIFGTLQKPSEMYDSYHLTPRFKSLIQLRSNFTPELAKSTEHL